MAAPVQQQQQDEIREKIMAPVPYTEEELAEMRTELAGEMMAFQKIEEDKKTADASFKAKMDAHWDRIGEILEELKAKKHSMEIEAIVEFDDKSKTKQYLHPETRAVLKKAPMEPKDFQRPLLK